MELQKEKDVSTGTSGTSVITNIFGIFSRLYWLIGAPVAMLFVVLHSVLGSSYGLRMQLIFVASIFSSAIAVRFLDHTVMHGSDADGEKSTISSVVRYCKAMVVFTLFSLILLVFMGM